MGTVALGINVSRTGGLDRKILNYKRRAAGSQDRINDAAYRGIITRCPIHTGNMKSTIHKFRTADGSYTRVGAFYGIYVNHGTRNRAPRPFFTQGVRINGVNQLRREVRTLWR